MANKFCNVIFPGAFKPVHYGHISLMRKYLDSVDYNVKLTVVISKLPREGISAETSKWFLEQVFKGNLNVNIIIAPDNSPIQSVYNMISMQEFGPGTYAMGTSAKGEDIARAKDCAEKFSPNGKYYTEGTEVIVFPINPEPAVYIGRTDLPSNTPISSRIVREDLRKHDYQSFRAAYIPLLDEHIIDENIIKQYYSKIIKEVTPAAKSSLKESCEFDYNNVLNEGGAAGHMEHPYDILDFTFNDLGNFIKDLFTGKITDITEKLDGQNLFASVDNSGNTIFARNNSHLYKQPMYLGDIMDNPKWADKPNVQHAFSNAAITVDKIFKNIPKRIEFFNYKDNLDNITYRYWVNLEILDTQNYNVIPYAESKVSFHSIFATSFDSNNNKLNKFELEEDKNSSKFVELRKAIDKTNRTTFGAQITPEVIFKKLSDGEAKAQHYIDSLAAISSDANCSMNTTIRDYKKERICRYLEGKRDLNWIDNEVLTALCNRWIDNDKSKDIRYIAKNCKLSTGEYMSAGQYDVLREFEKTQKDLVFNKILRPLDTLFIKLGNDVIKNMSGLANDGHEKEIVKQLQQELKNVKTGIERAGDSKAKAKLEQALARLAKVNNELNYSEGVVLKYKGHTLKLTGSFAPLNQILGAGFKEYIEK